MLLFPVYIKPEVTEATSKTATPSTLTFASTRSSATVHLDSINAVSGSFATSTSEQTASFSISTNNATGYTLTLKTTGNDTALTDDTNSNTSTNHLNTISSSTTADDFTVNTWGLIPSKYNGSDNTTTYYPASSTGFTIDETTTANTTANNYTVGIGIKVNYDTRSATYTNDTLIAEYVANPVTYSISYYSNTSDTVEDMPLTNPQTGTISDPTTSTGDIITTLASAPNRANYIFLGWCLGNSAGTADVTNNTSITNITTTNNIDSCSSTTYDAGQSFGIDATGSSPDTYYLYALWQEEVDLPCAAGYICYRGNGATAGTMPDQEATSNTNINLTPSNFSRPGYGFAGWNTSRDGAGTQYGPGERINPGDLSTEGLKLYAKWIAPTGILQTWAGASNMNVGDVIALRDNRDNEVYTVAKLADNNVWITENLRLVPNTANITAKNTNNPTAAFLAAVPSSSSSTTQCSTDDSPCNDQVYFYTGNMDRTKEQAPTGNEVRYAWYSYGTMYNWYTATAGHGVNSKSSGSVDGDICPSGWHLPTGGSSGEYAALSTALGGTSSTGATNIRKYPNNFIWSGDYNPSTQIPDGRGTQARIWSTTANSAAKSYRMGFNSSSITPAGTWNKWDNFAVRCIYQGGNISYSNVTVDFEGTGISSITFTNSNYGTETATPASPTVSIAEEAAYTVTATMTTGYEVSSWATTANGTIGDTTTTNPAANPNTYTITGEATLTVTGAAIPTYDVTITLGEHVTGISFYHADYGTTTITPASASCTDNNDDTYTCTTSLRRGIEYTLSSSYEYAYTLHEWTIGSNSTIGSTTATATTYSITGNTTLGITAEEADELTYTLVYSAGQGTDAPDSVTVTSYQNTHTFTITNSAPIYYGYTFTGWSETADANNNGTTVDYTSGDTITVATTGVTTTKTLYPVYQAVSTCPSSRICYYENGADVIGGGRGTMANQSASSNSSAKLIPTNYSKAGYGFAGWTTSENATPYGPNATITTPDLSSTGLALYAKWVKSTGTLQTWNGCNSLNTNDVTALTDSRDNETYAVAKLGDDKCWIIENLRLVPSTANITSANTHNPASGFATEAASSSSSNALCTTDGDSSCMNQLQYNTNSLDRTLTQSYNTAGDNVAWYSYGVYYNWYTATAGNGTFSTAANTNVAGDICPSKWHLPTSTASGEWASLNTAVNGGVSNADAGLRTYPVNLVWSGDYNGSSRTSGYTNGRYWSSTGLDSDNAYRMGHQESGSKGATPSGNYRKWDAFAVRCIYDGDIANPHDVTVTLPTGVESITFTSSTYGTQTATSQNNTVSLAENATYTITANMTTGYELVSWTGGSNSTISDSSANPTTIRITDDTTLTLTAQIIPTYTVTVSLDSNTTSIVFTSTGYPAQSVTTNGDTVTLRRGVSYTITASFATSYELGSWSNGTNSTIGSTTTNPTTFTVTGASTLSVTSQQQEIAPPNCASSPAISTIAPGITYMQDINSSNYNTILSNMSTTTSYKIKDSRDDQNYCIAKLADGKIWMTSNLNLAGGTALSASDTDVDASYISSFTTSNRLTKTGNTIVLPASSTSGFDSYNDAYVYNSNSTTCGSGSPCYSYYSWAATTLGSGKSITTDNTDAPYSICPKGWRLPKTGAVQNKDYKRGDFYALATVYGANLDLNYYDEYSPTFNEFYNNAGPGTIPNFLLAGSYNYGSFMFDASPGGDYWSATSDSSEYYARGYFIQSTNVRSTGSSNRYFGYSVRCIATQPTSSVTVSMDSGVSSVTFSDGTTTQAATSANPTVTLTDAAPYTITASFATGYKFASWSTTSGGALASTTTNPTTYTVTDTATLTVTSATISSITDLTYMQDFATLPSATKTNVLNAMTLNQQYTLKDSRDQKDYYISKLADGNVWMTQNLDHDIVTTAGYYTPQNTDIPSAWTPSTATYTTGTTTWDMTATGYTTPQSYDPGDLCWDGTINENWDGTLNDETTTCGSDKHMHIGNYYNWTSAVAMNDSSSYTVNNTDVDQSICPAGWMLPKSGTTQTGSKSFQYLWDRYRSSFNENTMMNSPLYFSYAGFWQGSSSNVGSYVLYWSSVVYESNAAYEFSFGPGNITSPKHLSIRVSGNSIRCVAR